MIHRIAIEPGTSIAAAKKEFRKCLMTGGAVVRLRPELQADALEQLLSTFGPDAQPHSLQALVIVEIVRHPSCTEELRKKIAAIEIPEIQRELAA